MHLTHRPAQWGDLDTCSRLMRGDQFYDPALRARRTEIWRRQIVEEAMLSVVIEDKDLPAPTRIRAFSTSVFVSDAFIAEAKAGLPPGLVGHLHARSWTGKSPILGPAAIRRANAHQGLNVIIDGYGFAERLSSAEAVPVIEMMFGCFFSYHAGYQIKEMLVEQYGQERALMNIAAGLRLRTDYVDYLASHPETMQTPDQQPMLTGLTREEAFASLGNRYFPLFLYTHPQLGFRPAEQRLLSQALRGGTNEECARALGVSPSAVKKCWETVYARVSRIDPSLLDSPADAVRPEAKRGAEKKPRLLAYLQQHPEELRPYQR
ncbi:MAG: hypothetical protein M3Y13_06430 [Armatimonadota bacterium]|nr:hypothetical protein [Armatimonadota bacterium]